MLKSSLLAIAFLCVASAAQAQNSFLTQGSGSWSRDGDPVNTFHDERPDGGTWVGRYADQMHGVSGDYRLTPIGAQEFQLDLWQDDGVHITLATFWTPQVPNRLEQPAWGTMWLR